MQQRLTKHAQMRMQQRGVKDLRMEILRNLADLELPVGRGLHAMRLSQRALSEARAQGLSAQEADRLQRMVLVESADGALVTVAHLHGGKAKAYTRRDRRKFWR